jgi:flagellar hook-associated protein FlgK
LKIQLLALHELVNVTTHARTDGSVRVALNGATLLKGSVLSNCLTLSRGKVGHLRLQTPKGGARLKLTGGNIARKIEARDGRVTYLQAGLNKLAVQLIARANSIYMARCDANGRVGQDLFCGTDASNISVNTSVTFNQAAERRRSRNRPRQLKWYQQACQEFDTMKARLDQFRPMR